MEIIRQKSELGTYDFYITEGNKTLKIIYGGNGDLYWILDNSNVISKTKEAYRQHLQSEYTETFTITKENYLVYSLFEKLIKEVSETRIYRPNDMTIFDI